MGDEFKLSLLDGDHNGEALWLLSCRCNQPCIDAAQRAFVRTSSASSIATSNRFLDGTQEWAS